MKISLKEIKELFNSTITEAKSKKKKKKEREEKKINPTGYSYSESLDFSQPLGQYNLYKNQGGVNWGPMTGQGPITPDRVEAKILDKVHLGEGSAWDILTGVNTIWESAYLSINEKK